MAGESVGEIIVVYMIMTGLIASLVAGVTGRLMGLSDPSAPTQGSSPAAPVDTKPEVVKRDPSPPPPMKPAPRAQVETAIATATPEAAPPSVPTPVADPAGTSLDEAQATAPMTKAPAETVPPAPTAAAVGENKAGASPEFKAAGKDPLRKASKNVSPAASEASTTSRSLSTASSVGQKNPVTRSRGQGKVLGASLDADRKPGSLSRTNSNASASSRPPTALKKRTPAPRPSGSRFEGSGKASPGEAAGLV